MNNEINKNLPTVIDFFFDQNQIRTVFNTDTGQGYICLSDLLKAQGSTTWPNQVLPEIEDIFGKGQKIVLPLDTPGGIQDVIFISEPAATFTVSRGRTEAGKRLNRWLHTEVIPSIRKTGGYHIAPGAEQGVAPVKDKAYYVREQRVEAIETDISAIKRNMDIILEDHKEAKKKAEQPRPAMQIFFDSELVHTTGNLLEKHKVYTAYRVHSVKRGDGVLPETTFFRRFIKAYPQCRTVQAEVNDLRQPCTPHVSLKRGVFYDE